MIYRIRAIAICLTLLLIMPPSHAASTDLDRAKQILDTSDATLKSAQSARADFTIAVSAMGAKMSEAGTIECVKPNLLRYELWRKKGLTSVEMNKSVPHELAISDGKAMYVSDASNLNRVIKYPAGTTDRLVPALTQISWNAFFDSGAKTPGIDLTTILQNVKLSTATWNGDKYTAIESGMNLPEAGEATKGTKVKVLVGADKLVHRVIMVSKQFTYDVAFKNVRLNTPIPPAHFAFTKPAYATVIETHIDAQAVDLLKKVDEVTQSTQAVTATVQCDTTYSAEPGKPVTMSHTRSTVRLLRPNYAWIETVDLAGDVTAAETDHRKLSQIVSDGANLYTIGDLSGKKYKKSAASDSDLSSALYFGQAGPFSDFFDPRWARWSNSEWGAASIVDKGEQTWNGSQYRVVEVTTNISTDETTEGSTYTVYVGSDNRIRRVIATSANSSGRSTGDYWVVSMETAPKLSAADFAFTPPAGMTAATDAEDEAERPAQKPLLSKGTRAPDFTVHDRAGKPVRLSDYKGKVVVLDFWATWCGPCQASLPSTNAVARKFRKQNVVVLGVNVWDTPDAFKAWLPQHKDYDAIRFAIDPRTGGADVASSLYNVTGIPTQYVIDRGGKIAWSTVGSSGSDDELVAAIKSALSRK